MATAEATANSARGDQDAPLTQDVEWRRIFGEDPLLMLELMAKPAEIQKKILSQVFGGTSRSEQIKIPKLDASFQILPSGEAETNSNGDNPLILAARTGNLEIMEQCCHVSSYRHSKYPIDKDSIEEFIEADFKECLFKHRNKDRETAFFVLLKNLLLNAEANCEAKINFFFDKLIVRDSHGTPTVKCCSSFKRCNQSKQNVLHLLFSEAKTGSSSNKLNAQENIIVHVLKKFEEHKIWINPRKEDDKKFTPLLYLAQSPYSPNAWQAFKDYCLSLLGAKDTIKDPRKMFKWQDLLHNSQGMDIVHARAGFQLIEELFKPDMKTIITPDARQLVLYDRGLEFSGRIQLGGPIVSDFTKQGSLSQGFKFQNWTALHFASKKCHFDNMKYLMRHGFSLQDITSSGDACAQLMPKDKRDEYKTKVLKILQTDSTDKYTDNCKDLVNYISSIDSVKCAIDHCHGCHGDCDDEAETEEDDEAEENEEVEKAIVETKAQSRVLKRLNKNKINYSAASPKTTVYNVLWLCFKDDDSSLYRDLLHSSFWREYSSEEQFWTAEKDLIKHFLLKRDENKRKQARRIPKVQVRLKDERFIATKLNFKGEDHENSLLFPYLNNGEIFLVELLRNDDYYKIRSLTELAVRTGRPNMAKALLITRQMDLIPNAVEMINVCKRAIEKEHLLKYYPIMDSNNELKSLKRFAAKVAMNAIDTLFSGCTWEESKLVFTYLNGNLMPVTEEERGSMPSSKLSKVDENRQKQQGMQIDDNPETKDYSTLELVRKSGKVEFFSTECFQQMIKKMWSGSLENSNRRLRFKNWTLDRVFRYLSSPRRKLLLYSIMNLVFIAFLISSITHASVDFNWTDVIIFIFLVGYITQELHELTIRTSNPSEGFRSYLFDFWNMYDISAIILLTAAFGLKFYFLSNGWSNWGDIYDFDASKLKRFQGYIFLFYNYKILMSTSLLFASVKFLKNLRYIQSIGLNLVIMPTIFIQDLLPFVVILLLLLAAFGTFFFATLTVGRYGFNETTPFVQRSDGILFDLYVRPLLAAFGEFQFDSLDGCNGDPSKDAASSTACYYPHGIDVFKRFALLLFLLIVNLVMFNMLIARFSNTVGRYEHRSRKIWLALRDEMLIDYKDLSALPPPFNIVGTLYIIIQYLRKRNTEKVSAQDHSTQRGRLAEFYVFQAERFCKQRHRIHTQRVETIEDDIEEKLNGENPNEATHN